MIFTRTVPPFQQITGWATQNPSSTISDFLAQRRGRTEMLTRARSRMQDSLNRVVRDGVERFGASERTSTGPSDDSNARSNSSPTSVPQARARSSSRQLPPSVIDISVNSSSQADSHSISSNSHQSFITNYTRHSVESSISPISHPSKYSRALHNELVTDYVQRFCQ